MVSEYIQENGFPSLRIVLRAEISHDSSEAQCPSVIQEVI